MPFRHALFKFVDRWLLIAESHIKVHCALDGPSEDGDIFDAGA